MEPLDEALVGSAIAQVGAIVRRVAQSEQGYELMDDIALMYATLYKALAERDVPESVIASVLNGVAQQGMHFGGGRS